MFRKIKAPTPSTLAMWQVPIGIPLWFIYENVTVAGVHFQKKKTVLQFSMSFNLRKRVEIVMLIKCTGISPCNLESLTFFPMIIPISWEQVTDAIPNIQYQCKAMMLEGFTHSSEHLVLVTFSVVSVGLLFRGTGISHEFEIECGAWIW